MYSNPRWILRTTLTHTPDVFADIIYAQTVLASLFKEKKRQKMSHFLKKETYKSRRVFSERVRPKLGSESKRNCSRLRSRICINIYMYIYIYVYIYIHVWIGLVVFPRAFKLLGFFCKKDVHLKDICISKRFTFLLQKRCKIIRIFCRRDDTVDALVFRRASKLLGLFCKRNVHLKEIHIFFAKEMYNNLDIWKKRSHSRCLAGWRIG